MVDWKKIFGTKSSSHNDFEQIDDNDLQLATAILLLNIARADEKVAAKEQEHIIKVLKKKFELDEQEANELFALSEKEIEQSIDIWQFTNQLNQNMEKEERLKILQYAWEIIYTDKKLDPQEDYIIHKLANLLRLSHKELIQAKLKVKKS